MTIPGTLGIAWSDLSEKTLKIIPWWKGCYYTSKAGRVYYWRPVEEMTEENISHDYDIDRWLADTPYDDMLVNLGDDRLALFDGGSIDASRKFKSIVYNLALTESITHAENLNEIQANLQKACIKALYDVGDELRIGPPPRRSERIYGRSHVRSISEVADEVNKEEVLVFIAARYAHRDRIDAVRTSLRRTNSQTTKGWVPFELDASRRSSPDYSVRLDFSELSRSIDPDALAVDPQNAFLVVAPRLDSLNGQQEFIAGALEHLREFLPLQAQIAGRDNGRHWLVASFGRENTGDAGSENKRA